MEKDKLLFFLALLRFFSRMKAFVQSVFQEGIPLLNGICNIFCTS